MTLAKRYLRSLILFSYFFSLHFLFSAVYLFMKNCINNVFYECKNNTDPQHLIKIASRARVVIGSEDYFCKDGMLNSFKKINLQPDCPKKATKKVKNCAASFHKEFRDDKASPSLCRLDLQTSDQILPTFGFKVFQVSFEILEVDQDDIPSVLHIT